MAKLTNEQITKGIKIGNAVGNVGKGLVGLAAVGVAILELIKIAPQLVELFKKDN